MRTSVIWVPVACSLLLSACKWVKDSGVEGNGVVVEKTFDILDTRCIKLNVPAEVIYTVSEVPSMTVRLDANLMQYVKVSIDSTFFPPLEIGSTRPLRNVKEFTIFLSSSGLNSLHCSNGVRFKTKGLVGNKRSMVFMDITRSANIEVDSLEAGSLRFSVMGGGSIIAHSVKAPYVDLSVVSTGVLRKRGEVDATRVSLSGESERVNVALSGLGEVDLTSLDYKLLNKKTVGRSMVFRSGKPSYKSEPVQSPNTGRWSEIGSK